MSDSKEIVVYKPNESKPQQETKQVSQPVSQPESISIDEMLEKMAQISDELDVKHRKTYAELIKKFESLVKRIEELNNERKKAKLPPLPVPYIRNKKEEREGKAGRKHQPNWTKKHPTKKGTNKFTHSKGKSGGLHPSKVVCRYGPTCERRDMGCIFKHV